VARRIEPGPAARSMPWWMEAGATALLVFALTVALVGLEVVDAPGRLELTTRFYDVGVLVVFAFVGRVGIILLRQGHHRIVALGAGVIAAALFVTLGLAHFGGPSVAPALRKNLPFNSLVIEWLLAGAALAMAIYAATRKSGAFKAYVVGRIERTFAPAHGLGGRLPLVFGLVLVVIAVTIPFWPSSDRRTLDIAILILTYVMLGWGLNVVVGLAGLLDLGYVAFYAVGAYSYALFATTPGLEFTFWICLPFAGIMAAFWGVLLGFPVLRLRGDYLAIVTLGFGEMIRIVLINWAEFSGGPNGISGIPVPTFFGLHWANPPEGARTFNEVFGLDPEKNFQLYFLYYLILLLALVTNWFTLRLRKLPIGRAWEALREDETACRSLGINPTNTKLTAFGIGAMFAGFAGSFFATKQGFISPESFTFIESAVILAIVVLGGFGSQLGVVAAAFLLIGMPEFFREFAAFRMVAFGVAMIAIMLWRPAGLIAVRETTVRLHPKRRANAKGAA
jgi:branched-chain amino acid transport system permease protein